MFTSRHSFLYKTSVLNSHLFHKISFRDLRIFCRIWELGCDWIGIADTFTWLLPDAVGTEDGAGLLSPAPKLEDATGFLGSDEPGGAEGFEGTLSDEGHGFLGITPLKLPVEDFSGCLVSGKLEKVGAFLGRRFLVREDVCFSATDVEATALFDATVCSAALSSFFFSPFWAVKTKNNSTILNAYVYNLLFTKTIYQPIKKSVKWHVWRITNKDTNLGGRNLPWMQKNTPCQTEGFNSSTSAVQTENLIHTLCKKKWKRHHLQRFRRRISWSSFKKSPHLHKDNTICILHLNGNILIVTCRTFSLRRLTWPDSTSLCLN